MLTTLAQAKKSRLKRIAGACPDSSLFLQYVNDGTRMLLNRGNFWNTVKKIRVCSYAGCIAWPSYVLEPLAVNICGRSQPVRNYWYEFEEITGRDVNPNRIWPSNVVVESDGQTPVFRNVPCGTPLYIRAYPRRQNDLGKTVTIYGIDDVGQTVMSDWPSGEYREGFVLTLGLPFVSTPKPLREITRVSKDETEGPIDIYGYDAATNLMIEMAHYRPSETEPSYQHSTVQAWRNVGCCGCADGLKTILALIKMAFVPVQHDTDLVQIENLDALALAVQGAKLSDAYDSAGSEGMMARAVHELNLELAQRLPIDQIPISIQPFGTAIPSRAGIGRVF